MLLFPSLLLLFLSACAASPAASPASYNFYNDTITATVNLLTHSVRVKAFGSVKNAAVLHKLHSEKSLATRLSWATPGVPQLFIVNSSAADATKFFKFHDFGVTAKLQLKSATVAKSLAAAAGRELAVEIDESQIHLLDIAAVSCQIFCHNNQLCDPMEATVLDVRHEPMLLNFINPSRDDTQVMELRRNIQDNPLQVVLKCNVNYVEFNQSFVIRLAGQEAEDTSMEQKLMDEVKSLTSAFEMLRAEMKNELHKSMTAQNQSVGLLRTEMKNELHNSMTAQNQSVELLRTEFKKFSMSVRNTFFNAPIISDDETWMMQYKLKDYLATVDNRTFVCIQNRTDGSVNFNRNWQDYENGFGNDKNQWIGLKTISALTAKTPRTLRVELTRFNGDEFYGEFVGFQVLGADTKYLMNYSHMDRSKSTFVGDALEYHKNEKFTTYDNDNDKNSGYNCARMYPSGWWFTKGYRVNPNGIYYDYEANDGNAIQWFYVHSRAATTSYKSVRMMVELN